jgi:hypothetical protein
VSESEFTRKRGSIGKTGASDGAMHRHSGLKVSVVYRVPDGLNDLNGLNCLNEQRSLPSGLRFGRWFGEPRSQSDPGKDRD